MLKRSLFNIGLVAAFVLTLVGCRDEEDQFAEGCTDETAINYDEYAEIDDGSCTYPTPTEPIIDGHTYEVVQIGNQVWFAENLFTTTYANGDPIASGLSEAEWATTSSGAMVVYGEGEVLCDEEVTSQELGYDACDETVMLSIHGRLYNYHAVNDSRGLCPVGWHVPSTSEWNDLVDYIVDAGYDGTPNDQMRATSGWVENILNPTTGTDNFGFAALPGGSRYVADLGTGQENQFSGAGSQAHWWTSDDFLSSDLSYSRLLELTGFFGDDLYSLPVTQQQGLSVRCLRDE